MIETASRMTTALPAPAAKQRLASVVGRLSVVDRERVTVLLQVLGEGHEVTVAVARTALFPQQTDGAATKAIQRLVENVNEATSSAGVDLALAIRGARRAGPTGRTIGFTAQHVELTADPLTELKNHESNLIPNRQALLVTNPSEPRLRLTRLASGKLRVRMFLSWAAGDKVEVARFWDLLGEATGALRDFEFELWSFDRNLLLGEHFDERIRDALAEADIGLFALSNAFLKSEYIRDVELRAFVTGSGPSPGKRMIPVLLKPVDLDRTDLHGIEKAWIFGSNGPFSKARSERDTWVMALVDEVFRVLDKYADEASVGESMEPSGSSALADLSTRVLSMGDGDLSRLDYILPPRASPGGVAPEVRSEQQANQVDALDYLKEWASSPERSLAALLGEYGMGKTIACQALTARLSEGRSNGERLPEPLYFDLRWVAHSHATGTVPTLEEIIDECVRRSWRPHDGAPLPTAHELLDRARAQPVLFIFDGLDEVLVRLTEAQGVIFTRELLKLRPQRSGDTVHAPFGGTHTKVLISCRTHYFRTLRDQSGHFSEQHRSRATPDDYAALVLLPLTDDQVRRYLAKALPERDAEQLMGLLGAVHDLRELTSRPFTLAEVAKQIPFIDECHRRGEPVYGATIYERMAHDWLARDEGKHQLKPTHKVALTARLAAWMWRSGSRLVDSNALEAWLHEQLDEPEFARRYTGVDKDKLEEDLRTATFVVREDSDRGSAFRFAHTSIQEFFLARFLLDAMEADHREAWCIPRVNAETLEFLGQLLAEHPDKDRLLATIRAWRAPYLRDASELLVQYALHAREHGRPGLSLAGVDLSGASLRDWSFAGVEGDLLDLRRATLRGCDLRGTDWRWVDLDEADLTGASLDWATFDHVSAREARFDHASIAGGFFHDSRLGDASFDDARLDGLRSVRSGVTTCERSAAHTARTRLQLRTLGADTPVRACAADPEGRWLATGTNGGTQIWDTTTWEPLRTLDAGDDGVVSACGVDPEGRWLATGTSGEGTQIWDTTTWEHLRTVGAGSSVSACAADPEGRWLAAATWGEGTQIWDTTTWEPLRTLGGYTRVSACAVHPEGRWLATGTWGLHGGGGTQIWDTTTWEPLRTLGAGTEVWVCAVDPEGRWLATGTRGEGTQIWDTTTWEPLCTLGAGTWVSACAVDPEGRWLATGTSGGTQIWDTTTWEHLRTVGVDTSVWACAVDPEGRWLATGTGGGTQIWDTTTWEPALKLDAGTSVWACAVDPEGRWLATGTSVGTQIWDTTTWEHLRTVGVDTSVWACAVDPEGRWLATGTSGGKTQIWDTTTWEPALKLEAGTSVSACAVDPEGRWLATETSSGKTQIWDTTTWEPALVLAHFPHGCAVWSPSDEHLHFGSDEAWRWLRVATFDDADHFLGVEPYELHHPTHGEPRPVIFGETPVRDLSSGTARP